MQGKFGRNYRLDIFTPQNKQVTIEPPFSIQFNLNRNVLSSANRGEITLYNLGANTRNQIFKDRYSLVLDWPIALFAGYGNRLHKIFIGKIFEAYSYKQNTEWITKIAFFDGMGAIQNSFTSVTVDKNTTREDIIKIVVADMKGVDVGALGTPAQGEGSPRGKSLIGQTSEILTTETDGKWFIDLAKINVLGENEVIEGRVIKLDPDDLLSTPRRRETFLDVSVLFEPQIEVGHIYEIESLEPKYNGQFKVLGFKHNVTISSAAAGNAITDIVLQFGASGLQEVAG